MFEKGNKFSSNRLGKKQTEEAKWRSDVFQRDNWTCQTCNERSKKGKFIYLEAHHIKEWAKFPKLRYNTDNGLTLCRECHKLTRKSH